MRIGLFPLPLPQMPLGGKGVKWYKCMAIFSFLDGVKGPKKSVLEVDGKEFLLAVGSEVAGSPCVNTCHGRVIGCSDQVLRSCKSSFAFDGLRSTPSYGSL